MSRHLLVRAAKISVTSITVAAGLLYGTLAYQDWSAGQLNGNSNPGLPIGPGNPPSAENFSPMFAVPPMPVVTGFKIVAADEITGEIADDDLVIGIEIDGKSRAYSINMMTGPSREIFNDTLAGRPIAATW